MSTLPAEAARLDAELDAALDFGLPFLRTNPAHGQASGGAKPFTLERPPDTDNGAGDYDGDSGADVDAAETETATDDVDEEMSLEADSVIEPLESPRSQAGQTDNIRVFVRVRPPNSREGSATSREIVRVDTRGGIVHLLGEPVKSFAFDGVLGESSSQHEVFDLMGAGVGDACLNGYNGSVYVYGQTGSGKTHTMQGPVASVRAMRCDEQRGIMCRLLDHIFSEIAKRHKEGGSTQYSCKCSYLEIYKEQITDLLEPSSTNLQVREDINRGVYVERLSEHSVWTISDAFHVVWKGLHQRHVAATQMNELSSRSHSVFTLRLEATSTTPGGVTSTRIARLNLIDLAGSERQGYDPHNPMQNESLRVKEAGAINKSLSALTNVIMSLSNGHRRRSSTGGKGRPFVRYRDSKLTFLLRDSLGGNSKTVIVACASPSALCFGETLSTLKFAARAKHIRCTAIMNEEYSGTVESLMLEVKSLKSQLEVLSLRGLIPGASGTASQASLASASAPRGLGFGFGEDPVERLLEAGSEELRRLCGQKRALRLEILLGGALDRERRCELRRHKLEKFTQYLNGLLERKEQYFEALRDYFSFLVDGAAGEAWYLPELTARLVVFRQQLCSVAMDSDSREQAADMLDGAMEALVAEDDDGDEGVTELSLVASSRDLGYAGDPSVHRSRSYSYGLLMGKEARRSRKSVNQLRGSTARLQDLSASVSSAPSLASAPARPQAEADSVGRGARPSLGGPVSEDEALAALRKENRLLRRLLENHPELHRYSVENRLLREHLASVIKQRAAMREDPQQGKPQKQAQRPRPGASGGGSLSRGGGGEARNLQAGLTREQSLTRNTRSSRLLPMHSQESLGSACTGQSGFSRFPGTEEATQISDSSSSGDSSGSEDSEGEGQAHARPAGVQQAAAPFLGDLAKNVEELLRDKASLEDAVEQQLRQKQAAEIARKLGNPRDRAAAVTEVDPRSASEVLRGVDEALKVAEGLLTKTRGEALWLSAGGHSEDVGGSHGLAGTWNARSAAEGLDERNVFLSLMRSLPTEAQGMPRAGCASSAPSLSPKRAPAKPGPTGSQSSRALAPGTAAGARLLRNRSTKQLHRIAEHSGSEGGSPAKPPNASATPAPGASGAASSTAGAQRAERAGELPSASTSADMLRDATLRAQELCSRIESIGDAFREMQEQKKPLREEYYRKHEEGKFLEAQYRRLDIHCRLLEERASSLGGLLLPNKPGTPKPLAPRQVPQFGSSPAAAPAPLPTAGVARAVVPDAASPQARLQRRSLSTASLTPSPQRSLLQQQTLHSAARPAPTSPSRPAGAAPEGGAAAAPRPSEELLRRVSSAPHLPPSHLVLQAAGAWQQPQAADLRWFTPAMLAVPKGAGAQPAAAMGQPPPPWVQPGGASASSLSSVAAIAKESMVMDGIGGLSRHPSSSMGSGPLATAKPPPPAQEAGYAQRLDLGPGAAPLRVAATAAGARQLHGKAASGGSVGASRRQAGVPMPGVQRLS